MIKLTTVLMASSVMLLSSCTSSSDGRSVYYSEVHDDFGFQEQREKSLPAKFSMLELGRALSKGAVDIYDPWLPTLTVPAPDFSVADPLSFFPVHPFMLIRDRSVRIYSTNSYETDNDVSFMNILNEVDTSFTSAVAPPVPLVEDLPLDPQS